MSETKKRSEVITIKLTPKEVDIADWLLGRPSMHLHSQPEKIREIYGRDMSHLAEPKLDKKVAKLTLPADGKVIENSIWELEGYVNMAKESGELTGTEMMTEVRMAKSLMRKLMYSGAHELQYNEETGRWEVKND